MFEFQPCDVRGQRGGDGPDFLRVHKAIAAEIEGWGGGIGEVVVADWNQALRDVGECDFKSCWRDFVEDGRVAAGDAGRVVKGGHGTDCGGNGSGS